MNKRTLTEQEAAQYIGMSRSFLRQHRMNGARSKRTIAPGHIRVGTRRILAPNATIIFILLKKHFLGRFIPWRIVCLPN
jgi:hypothetical protein